MEYFSHIVILCVGSNKIAGDSIGPIVGKKLGRLLNQKDNIVILGNLKTTLNFKNAKKVWQNIITTYQNPFIITVDSALGKKEFVNSIITNAGDIQIGSALGRSACYPSHINIKGIVGEYKEDVQENINTLKNVNKKIVNRLSNEITYELYKMLEKINYV